MRIIEGDIFGDLQDYDVILMGVAINNSRGNGWNRKLFLSYPKVDATNRATSYNDPRKLGTVTVVPCQGSIFALCFISRSRTRPDLNPDCLDYIALEKCLKLVRDNFRGKRIACSILGLSRFEGGGDRERILSIFQTVMGDFDITLYDEEQEDFKVEYRRKWEELVSFSRESDPEGYKERKKRLIWEEGAGPIPDMPDMNLTELRKEIKDRRKRL